ncbi:MarR family winged helix-turn-helix transcriptional regulator [Aurantibacillus circumpalustris]|uniref:MarR family winged helix-turn-helix transcriptional regulator n=1 Tax=Aurantibacillus circumpalustris TaxID=3036359 RepID=UPI00295A64F4|nr:MarR family transcriptional regulator [Aurantibacillus circumpalustris]
MKKQIDKNIPVGTQALILSKFYYGVISKSLEDLDIERYFSILYFLSENNGCNQQCICNHLAIDKTAMVKVIDYLIKADYVKRAVNPDDRRQHFITLTKKGQKRTEEIVKSFNALDEEIFKSISKKDKSTFISVLSSLTDNLKVLPSNDLFFNYKKTLKKGKQKINSEL